MNQFTDPLLQSRVDLLLAAIEVKDAAAATTATQLIRSMNPELADQLVAGFWEQRQANMLTETGIQR
ncbi:hypothetical protein ACWKSP_22310 [Micromonosporaceae bacterium Da 78-11]